MEAIKDKELTLDHIPSTVSPFIKEIIAQLLDKNPDRRPSAHTLLKNDQIQIYS